jgi:thiamine-monophosphate kinase
MNEDEIIRTYFAPLTAQAPGAFDLTDDAASLACPPGCELVVTADSLIAGVHFLPDDRPEDIAIKALAVNLSDLSAKGVDPLVYTLSMALPEGVSADWLTGFADGLAGLQRDHGIALLGGDTTRSPGPLMIAITAMGTVPIGSMVRRRGAKPGDLLCVTGTIGDAALGLRLRRGDTAADEWPIGGEARAFLIRRYLRPCPRTMLAASLREHASAALDISDGLILDATRLCRASGVTALIEADKVPVSQAASALAADETWRDVMLTGGDDYELLIAVPPGSRDALISAVTAAGLTVIGRIEGQASPAEPVAEPVTVADAQGRPLHFDQNGYMHFD